MAVSCKYGDDPAGSGATGLVSFESNSNHVELLDTVERKEKSLQRMFHASKQPTGRQLLINCSVSWI
jgi:hypothetical protein